eukprot:77681_1
MVYVHLEILELRVLGGGQGGGAVLVALGVLLEVAGVAGALRLDGDRRGVVAAEELLPVGAVEVGVVLDVRNPVLQRAEALGVVGHQQTLDEVARAGVEPVGELDLALKDLLVDAERRIV